MYKEIIGVKQQHECNQLEDDDHWENWSQAKLNCFGHRENAKGVQTKS